MIILNMDHHLLAYYIGVAIILYTHIIMLSPQQISSNPTALPPDQMHALINLLAAFMIYYYRNGGSIYWYYLGIVIILYTHWKLMSNPMMAQHSQYNLFAALLIIYWFAYTNNMIQF